MRNVTVCPLPMQLSVREALGSIQGTEAAILTNNFRVSSTECPDDDYKISLNYGHVISQLFSKILHTSLAFMLHTSISSLAKLRFGLLAFLKRLHQIAFWFHFFEFRNSIFIKSKVVSLRIKRHLRGLGLCIYVPQGQGGPVIAPGTGFSFLFRRHNGNIYIYIYICKVFPVIK
jgi:hypothetical protein